MDTLPGCLHTHTLAFIDGVEDGMKVRDRLLPKQAVTVSPLAWFTSALQPVL
jgi:hypothetical protein